MTLSKELKKALRSVLTYLKPWIFALFFDLIVKEGKETQAESELLLSSVLKAGLDSVPTQSSLLFHPSLPQTVHYPIAWGHGVCVGGAGLCFYFWVYNVRHLVGASQGLDFLDRESIILFISSAFLQGLFFTLPSQKREKIRIPNIYIYIFKMSVWGYVSKNSQDFLMDQCSFLEGKMKLEAVPCPTVVCHLLPFLFLFIKVNNTELCSFGIFW